MGPGSTQGFSASGRPVAIIQFLKRQSAAMNQVIPLAMFYASRKSAPMVGPPSALVLSTNREKWSQPLHPARWGTRGLVPPTDLENCYISA